MPTLYKNIIENMTNPPVAFYEMNEAAGTNLTDSIGSATLALTNPTGYELDKYGIPGDGFAKRAVRFIRANSGRATGTIAFLSSLGTGDRTFECWFKPLSLSVRQALMSAGQASTGNGFSFQLENASAIWIDTHNGYIASDGIPADTLEIGRWHHLVVTVISGSIHFYIDGTEIGAAKSLGSNSLDTANFTIGYRYSESDNHAEGVIDNVAVYDYGLSTTIVQEHSTQGQKGATGEAFHPYRYYRFTDFKPNTYAEQYLEISELRLSRDAVTQVDHAIPVASVAPTGAIGNLVDSDTGTACQWDIQANPTLTIDYDFGDGNGKSINGLKISSSTTPPRGIGQVKIQGSDDNTNWTDLYQLEFLPWPGATTEKHFYIAGTATGSSATVFTIQGTVLHEGSPAQATLTLFESITKDARAVESTNPVTGNYKFQYTEGVQPVVMTTYELYYVLCEYNQAGIRPLVHGPVAAYYEELPGGPTDEFWAYVEMLVKFNENPGSTNIEDASDNAYTGAVVGGADFTPDGKFDWAGHIENVAEYFEFTSAGSAFLFGTADFTIEIFAKFYDLLDMWIWGNRVDAYGTHLRIDANRLVAFSENSNIFVYDWTRPLDQWVHICLERYNGYIDLYINGVRHQHVTNSTDMVTNRPVTLGQGYDNWGSEFKLDEFRVTNGVARYKNEFTVPTEEYPSQ